MDKSAGPCLMHGRLDVGVVCDGDAATAAAAAIGTLQAFSAGKVEVLVNVAADGREDGIGSAVAAFGSGDCV
jgi:hypothetical protein